MKDEKDIIIELLRKQLAEETSRVNALEQEVALLNYESNNAQNPIFIESIL